jgi:predicted DNA-binding transcriptional regulator YafY
MYLISQPFQLATFISATTAKDAISVAELAERLPESLQGKGTRDSRIRNIRNNLRPLIEKGYLGRVEGGRKTRFYKKPPLTEFLKHLTQFSANEDGKAHRVTSERLNDIELQQRLIGLHKTVVNRLDTELIGRIREIKSAIQDKRKLTFAYNQGEQDVRERTVEPIGMIKDSRHTVMVAFNEHGEVEPFTVMRMFNLYKKYNEKHFHLLSQDEAITLLQSGIEEEFLDGDKELIVLELSSKAVDLYREERPRFCEDWRFEYTDLSAPKARVSFKRRLSVKFIADLMSLGNQVNILGSERLSHEIRKNQPDYNRVG